MADSPLRKNDDAERQDNRETAADEPDKQAQPAAELTSPNPPSAEPAADAKHERPAEQQGDSSAFEASDRAALNEMDAASPESPPGAAEFAEPPFAGAPPSEPDPLVSLAGESTAHSFQPSTGPETSDAAVEDVGLDSDSVADGSDETTNAAANDGPADEPFDDELSAAELEIQASENPDEPPQPGDIGKEVSDSYDVQPLSADIHVSAPIDPTLIYNLDGPPPKFELLPYDPSKETSHLEQLPYRFIKDNAGSEPSSGFDAEPGRTPPWPDEAFVSPEPFVQTAPVFVTVSLADSQIDQLIESTLAKSMGRDLAAIGELAESVVEHAFWLRTCHERALSG